MVATAACLAACENDQTAAVAASAATSFAASSVPGRGVPTTTMTESEDEENSCSKSSSDILGSPVVVLIFFCMSGVSVDLLDCCHYNKDRKVFQFFPEFNIPVSFIFFFMK